MSQRGVVFLMYHELQVPGRPPCQFESGYMRYVVVQEDFRFQMQWLQQAGWRGMSVTEALALGQQNDEGHTCVAITFDDGCETDFTAAAPILKQAGCNATFYATVEFLGRRGYMNPSQLKELSTAGFEVGCHSMTHSYLTDLDDRGLRREIVDSKAQLEEIVGKPVDHFSCPGGRYDAHVIRFARDAGYRSVANSRIQANTLTADTFALGRIAITRGTGLATFQSLCRAEGLWKTQVHDGLRNTAKQVLGNSLYDRVRARLLG
jgi:peptidoglycan/xylan/chitin deacetylase (PgdA/CDA1 family)